jgi:type II secretory ATPase GspE/PulE/Tfp pilus assembly ATPase PilB-like protein
VTLEDPIELQIPGINQVQVGQKNGLTFARGLRAILRQDPNVIMIGEIRDRETVEIAIGAALTGHLVLTTLHTQDSASAITRLLDMGVAPYLVSAACIGVVAQRLVRKYCTNCRGVGCVDCNHLGYHGRTGAFEVLEMREPLRKMILSNDSLDNIRMYLKDSGYVTLAKSLKKLVEQRVTSLEEIYRVMPHEEAFRMV